MGATLEALRRLRDTRGRTVTLARDGYAPVQVVAVPAGLSETAASLRGATAPVNRRDYIVLAADYVIGGNATVPERDDMVIDGQRTYRAVSGDAGRPVYETLGEDEAYRVHVVEVQ